MNEMERLLAAAHATECHIAWYDEADFRSHGYIGKEIIAFLAAASPQNVIAICGALAASQRRVSELETALRKYGGHMPSCAMGYAPDKACDCGYSILLSHTDPAAGETK